MARDRIDAVLEHWRSGFPEPLEAARLERLGAVARIRLLAQRFDQALEALERDFQVPHGSYDLLAALYRSGPPYELTAGALTQAIVLSPGALTNRMTRLESAGLLVRSQAPEDKRSVRVRLTQTGLDFILKAFPQRLRRACEGTEALDPAELEALNGLLRKLL